MEGSGIILVCVFTPLLGAFLLPLLGRVSSVLRNMAALLFVLASFVTSALLLSPALDNTPVTFLLNLPLGFSFGFLGDGLAVFMAMISSFVAAIIVFYSFGYMLPYKNQNEYYMMVVLFIGAMMGLVYSTNLILIYLFWEISAICCWRLIGFFREKPIVLKADKAFLVTVGGALLMFIGFLGIYGETGTFNLLDMSHPLLPNWIMILVLFGILSKSATLPLHTWLPDAGVAPSPVTSLLHAAVLVKIGVYMYARFFLVNFDIAAQWHTIVPVIAAISALVSAGAAIVENNIKRIIAYSTISQLAFIFLGLSCGVIEGIAGGLLYILMHSLAKGGLFLTAGIVEHSTHTKDIRQMGGLIRCLPATAVAFACCAFSVMGIPPFGGFFSKFLVIDGAFLTGNTWLAWIFLLGALMTVIYLVRVFVKVFFGQTTHPNIREGTWEMVGGVTMLAALSLIFGVFINLPAKLVTVILQNLGMLGR
ncbi:MAG: NADH-quinone oxidoreductase subunit L [Clostridiales bacterium]|nr:NADH-quinone oxidoreductase subunit L [Clostridiales bacterium]